MELIVLLDDQLRPVGSAPKLTSHHLKTPLHLAFSCYIFDSEGRFLLTRRSLSKKVWPGVWTNSLCGHPAPDEELEEAVRRRASYELGVSDLTSMTVLLPDYRYRTPPFNGVIENEFCPVYAAVLPAGSELRPAADEVADYKWVSWSSLASMVATAPEEYSYWMKDQLSQLAGVPGLADYLHS